MIGKIERWVNKPTKDAYGMAILELNDFICPLPVEMIYVKSESEIEIAKEYNFDFCFYCQVFNGNFKTEEDFSKSKDNKSMSSESIIPMGCFPGSQKPLSIVNCIVDEVVDGCHQESPDYYCAFLRCKLLGRLFDVVIYFQTKEELTKANIQKGDIISGVFHIGCFLDD